MASGSTSDWFRGENGRDSERENVSARIFAGTFDCFSRATAGLQRGLPLLWNLLLIAPLAAPASCDFGDNEPPRAAPDPRSAAFPPPIPAYAPAARTPGKLPDYSGFFYGMNYAWHNFGADFGGIERWGQRGVHVNPATYREELLVMRDHGVRVVRWWLLPELRGECVLFNDEGRLLGLGPSTAQDIEAALRLAADVGIDVVFTIFSFDNFRSSRELEMGVQVAGLAPLVVDPVSRSLLLETVVRPIAQTVGRSAYADRMVSWDLMNEPEWALQAGPGINGDPAFRSAVDDPITYPQMLGFLQEVAAILRQETPGVPIGVGGAASIWRNAWRRLPTDYHHFHMYDWIDAETVEGRSGHPYGYNKSPSSLGLQDQPVVVGEFPLLGGLRASHQEMVTAWRRLGYAGALSWSFTEGSMTAAEVGTGLIETLSASRALGTDGQAVGPRTCASDLVAGWDFSCGTGGFAVGHSRPIGLGSLARLDWMAHEGSGALSVTLPFSAANQMVSVSRTSRSEMIDLTGKILTARVRLAAESGREAFATVRPYVKGRNWERIPGPAAPAPSNGEWANISLDLSSGAVDAASIREVGLEFSSSEAGPFFSAELIVDSITIQ